MSDLEKAKTFIGQNVSYLGVVSQIKNIRQLKNKTILAYMENGFIMNIVVLRDDEGIYLDDKLKQIGDVKVST